MAKSASTNIPSKRSAGDSERGYTKRQVRQTRRTKRPGAMATNPLLWTANDWIGKDLPVIQKTGAYQPQVMNSNSHAAFAPPFPHRNPFENLDVTQEHVSKPDAAYTTVAGRKPALVIKMPNKPRKRASKRSVTFTDTTNASKRGTRSKPEKPNIPATVVEDTSPYTRKFFVDLAQTVATVFPFDLFAQTHCCSVGEVSQAISALVVAPLSDPTFSWTDSDMSIAEYGRSVIELYAHHYNSKMEELRYARAFSSDDSDSSSSSGGSSKDC